MPKLKREYLRLLVSASSLGIEMGVCIIIGYYMGRYLDKFFNKNNIFTTIFILLGILAGFKNLLRVAKQASKDLEDHKLDDVFEPDDKDKK